MHRKINPYDDDRYRQWTIPSNIAFSLESTTTSNSFSAASSQENVMPRSSSRSSNDHNQLITLNLAQFRQFQPRATSTPMPSTSTPDHERAPSIEHFEAYWKTIINSPYQNEAIREEIEVLRRRGVLNCQSVHPLKGSTLTKDIVLTMMGFANKLHVTDDVKYKALELFDSFALRKSEEMVKTLKSNSIASLKERAMKEEMMIKKQRSKVFFNMVMCIQLCSRLQNNIPNGNGIKKRSRDLWNRKYTAHSPDEILSNNEILDIVRHYNPLCDLKKLHKRGRKISLMVNWELNLITPMDYISSLIAVLVIDERIVRKIYSNSVLVSDFVYLEHEVIYEQYYELMIKKPIYYHLTRDDFRKIEHDLVLRGSAILMTAFYITIPQGYDQYSTPIENLLHVSKDELFDLSAIIIRLLHSPSPSSN